MDNSPFNRSGLTPRSPPPPPTPQAQSKAQDEEVEFEAIRTAELQQWMVSIEQCLNDVYAITTESKLNSEQKNKIGNLCRKVGHGVSQMAVHYQSLKQRTLLANAKISELRQRHDLAKCLNDIKNTIEESSIKTVTQKTSFADMVKKSANNFVQPSPLSSIAIYPSDKSKSSEETKNLVQKILRPEQMKLQVRGLRKTRNGGVIISTESKEDVEKLKNSSQLASNNLTVDEPYKRRPRIIILGVPVNLEEKELFTCIYEQNLADKVNMPVETFLSSIKLSHKSGKKEANYCNYILEVPALVRKALITQSRIFINWSSCPVRDFTLVTRCYKCQQYGHAAKTCREVNPMCGHCGESGHSITECTKKLESPKCATCLRFKKPSGHKTGDAECPARKAAEYRYINSTDYEGA